MKTLSMLNGFKNHAVSKNLLLICRMNGSGHALLYILAIASIFILIFIASKTKE
jgi:hypothetical protein